MPPASTTAAVRDASLRTEATLAERWRLFLHAALCLFAVESVLMMGFVEEPWRLVSLVSALASVTGIAFLAGVDA